MSIVMGMTNFLSAELSDHVLRGNSYSAPSELWLALHASVPNSVGSFVDEIYDSGTGYERIELTGLFSAPDALGYCYLNSNIAFPTPTIDWGPIEGASIATSGTHQSGTMLFYGPLYEAITAAAGVPLKITAGRLSIRLR